MNDEEVTAEVENENPLANMIDFTQNGEFNKANNIFSEIMNQRIQAALDQERVGIASRLYGEDEEDGEDIDPDLDDNEISDEDLDASADELVDGEDLDDDDEEET